VPPLVLLGYLEFCGSGGVSLRCAAHGCAECETQAEAANTREHRDLQVIYRHWRAKRGWHPALHPCHPLNLLDIYKICTLDRADSGSFGIILRLP
jgi:hypothetical protein